MSWAPCSTLLTRHGHQLPSLLWGGCLWTWEDAGRTESHSQVKWSTRASEAAGQLPGTQTPYKWDQWDHRRTRGRAARWNAGTWAGVDRGGVWVCGARLPGSIGLAEGASVEPLMTLPNRPLLPAGERGDEWGPELIRPWLSMPSWDPETETTTSQRSTLGHREERQGYCWYAPCRGPSKFHWQLNWLRSAKGAMVHHCNPQTTSATAWSRPRLSAARTRTSSRRR